MERTSISEKVDGTGAKTRYKCLKELPSASETGKLARDPAAQIIEFQEEEARDAYDKRIDLRKTKDKQNNMSLKAQSRGVIGETANLEEIPAKDYIRLKREIPKREEKGGKLKDRLEIENTTCTETKAKCAAENTRRTKEDARHKEKRARLVVAEIQKSPVGEGICASELEKFDERVENFVKQLDANVKSQVDYSDFEFLEKDLGKDWKMVRRFSVPSCLASISDRIFRTFGDFTSDSSQSDCATTPSFILFCAAIKEMHDMKLDQIDETRILLWRDAINGALNVQFKVDFAIKHLKKIARAYFGVKAMEWESSKELMNIDGTVKKMEVPEDCLRVAKYFWGKPLSTGLFR